MMKCDNCTKVGPSPPWFQQGVKKDGLVIASFCSVKCHREYFGIPEKKKCPSCAGTGKVDTSSNLGTGEE